LESPLKQKTITGLSWSFVDNFTNLGIQFVFGIILARLLMPKDYGLIGMVTIFIAVSQSFIDSGFSQALIRKKDCRDEDYSTVFFFNLGIGILCYLLLFASAGVISNFFNEPKLFLLVRVLGINLIINAFGLIERTILTKRIDFKLQTKISVISSVVSGITGIFLAYYGWGVWSLVAQMLTKNLINSALLWLWNKWNLKVVFDIRSFKELFGFGSKLLVSGLIDSIYNNLYYLIIGKYFSAPELGYYTRAEQFKNPPSQNLTSIIQRVSYPVLSTIQDQPEKLKPAYKKLIKCTMFISFVSMIGMAAVAEPMIKTLIGDKWLSSIPYLQLLCFIGMLYPLHVLNLNMLNIKGRSDLFLKLEIIKKILVIPTIVIGVYFGIKIMIAGMFVNSVIAYFLNSYWSGTLINYPMKEQVQDIMSSFLLAVTMGALVFTIGYLSTFKPIIILSIQLIIGALFTLSAARIFRIDAFMEMSGIIKERYNPLIKIF
jgi:teichuronic acid exporter